MSINSINRTQTLRTEQTLRTDFQKTSGTGRHNDKTVNQNSTQKAEDLSALSTSIPRSNLRFRNVRKPTKSESKGLFGILRLCFGGKSKPTANKQAISSPTTPSRTSDASMALTKGQTSGLIEAAQRGVAAAKSYIVDGLASKNSSAEVDTFLKSGDKGIRRGTTAIRNLAHHVSFTNLSDQEKTRMPAHTLAQLERQSGQIKEMAHTLSEAKFLDGKSNFFQFGTNENNGYSEAMTMHPEQDQGAREWVRSGLNLGSELINAQERVLVNGEALPESEMNDLQTRTNNLAGIEQAAQKDDPLALYDRGQSEMDDFAYEVLKKFARETEV